MPTGPSRSVEDRYRKSDQEDDPPCPLYTTECFHGVCVSESIVQEYRLLLGARESLGGRSLWPGPRFLNVPRANGSTGADESPYSKCQQSNADCCRRHRVSDRFRARWLAPATCDSLGNHPSKW